MIYLDGGKVGALDNWIGSVKTFEDARDFVMRIGVCCVLQNKKGEPNLYDAIDAPEKQSGEKGWGENVSKTWGWKNALPASYPDEIFYGKRKDGKAILCSMECLKAMYADQHRPVEELSETAQQLYNLIRQSPANNKELRELAYLTGKSNNYRFDRALLDLQIAFNIVRINRTDLDGDTWTLFTVQYPDFSPS